MTSVLLLSKNQGQLPVPRGSVTSVCGSLPSIQFSLSLFSIHLVHSKPEQRTEPRQQMMLFGTKIKPFLFQFPSASHVVVLGLLCFPCFFSILRLKLGLCSVILPTEVQKTTLWENNLSSPAPQETKSTHSESSRTNVKESLVAAVQMHNSIIRRGCFTYLHEPQKTKLFGF